MQTSCVPFCTFLPLAHLNNEVPARTAEGHWAAVVTGLLVTPATGHSLYRMAFHFMVLTSFVVVSKKVSFRMAAGHMYAVCRVPPSQLGLCPGNMTPVTLGIQSH